MNLGTCDFQCISSSAIDPNKAGGMLAAAAKLEELLAQVGRSSSTPAPMFVAPPD